MGDLSFAKDCSSGRFSNSHNNAINGLFFNSVVFDDDDVLDALGNLQGRSYQQVMIFNCCGRLFGDALRIIMTTMMVDRLSLEYSTMLLPGFRGEYAQVIGDALQQNSPVKSVRLNGVPISPNLGKALRDGLPCSNIESLEWVQSANAQEVMLMSAQNDTHNEEFDFWMSLLEGVRSCNTLERLDLHCMNRDKIMGHVMTTLREHPALRSLAISVNGLGRDIQVGMKNLVSVSMDPSVENWYDTDMFVESPFRCLKLSIRGEFSEIPSFPKPRNDKIKYKLEFIGPRDSKMDKLGEGLTRNHDIEEVVLQMLTTEGMQVVSRWLSNSQTRLPRLTISLSNIQKAGTLALLRAIQANPSWLEAVELPRGTVLRAEIQHFADLNRAGWSKMIRNEREPSVPIGLWSNIIARANNLVLCHKSKKENEARRADAIFHLLRGPATLHSDIKDMRQSFGSLDQAMIDS